MVIFTPWEYLCSYHALHSTVHYGSVSDIGIPLTGCNCAVEYFQNLLQMTVLLVTIMLQNVFVVSVSAKVSMRFELGLQDLKI